jgi:hypothetical protein
MKEEHQNMQVENQNMRVVIDEWQKEIDDINKNRKIMLYEQELNSKLNTQVIALTEENIKLKALSDKLIEKIGSI